MVAVALGVAPALTALLVAIEPTLLWVAALVAVTGASGAAWLWRRYRVASFRAAEMQRQREVVLQTISHEFRTPLTVIRGTAETLLERDIQPDLIPLLHATQRATARLGELVSLAMGATDAIDEEPGAGRRVELNQVVRSLVDAMPAEQRSRVTLATDEQLAMVTVEPHIRLALHCLLDNALRFSDGPVTIVVGRRDRRVQIDVTDEGPGLSDNFLRIARDPFTQADASEQRVHGGLGLGLYTADRLARTLGGELRLERPRLGGLRASILLPQRRQADRALEPRRHPIRDGEIATACT